MRCLLVSLVFLASLGTVSPVLAVPCVMTAGEAEVLQRVNALRASMKRPPLRCHPTLLQYARQWSQKMCDDRFFSHNDPAGKDNFSPRMARISMQIAQTGLESFGSAENIFSGSPQASQAIQSWMKSPGHRQNILSPTSTHLGTGYVVCSGRHLWTQIFMRLQKAAPTRHFGTRIPPSALPIEDDKSLLLLKVGTQQRRTTRQVTRTLQDGLPTTITTTTTTITTVYPGPRAGSRKIQTTVITEIETQSPRSRRSQRKERTRTRVIYDF